LCDVIYDATADTVGLRDALRNVQQQTDTEMRLADNSSLSAAAVNQSIISLLTHDKTHMLTPGNTQLQHRKVSTSL